jgi:hypothetical protein
MKYVRWNTQKSLQREKFQLLVTGGHVAFLSGEPDAGLSNSTLTH